MALRNSAIIHSFICMSVFGIASCDGGPEEREPPPVASYTAQELQEAMSITGAAAVSGSMPAGSDSSDMPQVTDVELPNDIEFGKLFQVKVTFDTGAKNLAKLFVQVEGASGYFELTVAALPNTTGEASFPCVINKPGTALTYTNSVSLRVQLEDEDGDAGVAVTTTVGLKSAVQQGNPGGGDVEEFCAANFPGGGEDQSQCEYCLSNALDQFCWGWFCEADAQLFADEGELAEFCDMCVDEAEALDGCDEAVCSALAEYEPNGCGSGEAADDSGAGDGGGTPEPPEF